jgi:glycosyltransferase involved in cell wall biosynthesis
MSHDKDIHGRNWRPCDGCPHPTPGACPSRAHRAFCVRLAGKPEVWAPRIAAMPHEDREPSPLLMEPYAPPPPFRRDPGRINVGFIGSGYWPLGGTERWHQTLLPRLADEFHVVGYAVSYESTGPPIGDIPVSQGEAACRAVMALSDVVVAWGLPDLGRFLPPGRRPRIVGVSHGSPDNAWNVECTTGMARTVDLRAAVSGHAAAAWPGGADGVTVIPNGVDPASMAPTRPRDEIRRSLGLEPWDVACLTVGWVSEGKRVELAAAAVAGLGPPFRLLVAGDGPRREAVAAAGGDRVMMLGRRDDVADLMHAADLLLHPSSSEGMALVHVEAQFAGLPIVSTPVGHLADFPDLARIVPVAAGPVGWARAIAADWADADARVRRAWLARWAADTECTADVFAARWAALVRSLAAAAPDARSAATVAPRGSQTPQRGRQAVESLAAARACPHRRELTEEEARECGCRAHITAVCLAGKSRKDNQRVLLDECVACLVAS